jgi:hypothetical protein
MPPLSAAPKSYLQATLQEYKLDILLYSDNNNQIQNLLMQIKKNNWDLAHFTICGIDLDKWIDGLETKMESRDAFINQIALNKSNKKIQTLKSSEML